MSVGQSSLDCERLDQLTPPFSKFVLDKLKLYLAAPLFSVAPFQESTATSHFLLSDASFTSLKSCNLYKFQALHRSGHYQLIKVNC
jgi:hypothetical protein